MKGLFVVTIGFAAAVVFGFFTDVAYSLAFHGGKDTWGNWNLLNVGAWWLLIVSVAYTADGECGSAGRGDGG